MGNRSFSLLISSAFIKRVLSAFIIIPSMILPVLFGEYSLIVIYLIILTFAVNEIFNIIRNSYYKIYSCIYLFITIFSIIYFIILLLSSNLRELFVLIIATIWLFDTFSYLGGKSFKGKKIFPNVSKGKTYSGLSAGLISTVIPYYFAVNYFHSIQFIPYYFFLIIAILAFMGDAIVSLLKRSANLKDSGNLIPGHGGFLDRLDSFIFVFFVVEIYFILI